MDISYYLYLKKSKPSGKYFDIKYICTMYAHKVMAIKIDTAKETMHDKQLAEVSLQIDKAFEQFYFEMDEDEAKAHMMKLIYHMIRMTLR